MTRLPLAAAAALAALPAQALTITETFEALGPRDTIISAPLVTSIGTITGLAGSPGPNVFLASPGYTNFGAGNNPTTSVILTGNGDEHFEANLAFAAHTVAMDVYLNDLGPAELRFFNGSTLLFTYMFGVSDPNFQTVSYANFVTPINRFTFVSTLGGQLNTGLDNISISGGPGVVPEPASWAMLIAGFGLVGAVRRRQRFSLS
jgi:PEP-CTERM motif